MVLDLSPEMASVVKELMICSKGELQILTDASPSPLVLHHILQQLTYVSAGRGTVLIGSATHQIHENTLVCIPPKTLHAFRSIDTELALLHWHWPQDMPDDRVIVEDAFQRWGQ